MSVRVHTVFYWVTDLDRSVEWYRRAGFAEGSRHGDWQTLSLDGDVVFALHGGESAVGVNAIASFLVEDLDEHVVRLGEAGIEPVDSGPTDTGRARFRTFADPDGNHVQFLELVD